MSFIMVPFDRRGYYMLRKKQERHRGQPRLLVQPLQSWSLAVAAVAKLTNPQSTP